jgi:glyoxylase-like metal-dependent hydrolase (beta-lactamase superfamily II)
MTDVHGTLAFGNEALARSTDMAPVHGVVEVGVPIDILWDCFTRADLWPRWNSCMYAALNRDLQVGERLIWVFDPLRWWLPYKLPGVATLVEVESKRRVTWEVTALPGFYAQHTYFMEDLGGGRSRFGSWEQAMGPTFRLLRRFWLAHFRFVCDRSLQGARYLETVYCRDGKVDEATLPRRDYLPLAGALSAAGRPLRLSWPTYHEIVPGVHAILGGGGNSVVIHDGGEVLLVDSKLPPFAAQLRRWIERHVVAPVRTLVNTHFHYDHTYGNHLYPGARIVAHAQTPTLMQQRDGDHWGDGAGVQGLPQYLVQGASQTLTVGDQPVTVHDGGQGHTAGDLWLHLRRAGKEIVVTGDVASLGVYPFFDLGPGGCDVPGMAQRLRAWAERFPQAIFVPGHGPLATARDLRHHAAYLSGLWEEVARARAAGLDEDGAVARIDLSRYRLSFLPIFHYEQTFLSAASNVRAMYRLQERLT